jgi:hypothetical protein
MEIALALSDMGYSGFLQKIAAYVGPSDGLFGVEVNLQILTEATGVVVPHGFAVAKSLKDGVASQQLLLNGVLFPTLMLLAEVSEHFHAIFGGLGFART